jgi:hypothetical protein
MTFDARKVNSASASSQQNALFALVTLAVVCGAFFIVLSWPSGASSKDAPVLKRVATSTINMPTLPGEGAEAYFASLGKVDLAAQADLSQKIMSAGKLDDRALTELVLAQSADVLKAHAGDLARADTAHIDHILDLARDHLRTASQKRSKWCDATRYAALSDMEHQHPDMFIQEMAELNAPLREFSFEALTGLMIAIEDAQVHPVERGKVTRADEAALQGMVMSIMADPDVLPLIVAVQSDADPKKALQGVNLCDIGATAVAAAKTLPQETKGRLLAEGARQLGTNGTSAFTSAVSF